jgi:hypothetical protein
VNFADPDGQCRVGATAMGAQRSGNSTVIICSDGYNEWRTGGSLAWRNNNPGNLVYTPWSKRNGAVGEYERKGTMGLAIFPDEKKGGAALGALLNTKGYQSLTMAGAVNKYAPPGENNTLNYQNMIEKFTGISASTPVSQLTSSQMSGLVSAIGRIEGWSPGSVTFKKNDDGSVTFKSSVTGSRIERSVACKDGTCK